MELKKHIQIALAYFLIIAGLGLVLRLYQVIDIPANYRFLVHTHSHVALLGWVYTALTSLLYYCFLRDKPLSKTYKVIFWSTQGTIIGMMLSFPFTGYALFSILFSTLFLIVSYWFSYFFLKNCTVEQRQLPSFKLARVAIWYLILSSIGPWTLGAIMTTLGSSSPWYRNAIYFFLHFQYNGWFILALFGLIFKVFEAYNVTLSSKDFRRFYVFLNTGVLLTFFISILWMEPHPVFYWLAGIGGLLQLMAIGQFFRSIYRNRRILKQSLSKTVVLLLKISALFLLIKLIAQMVGAFPQAAKVISANIDYVISYIHWTFLGVVSVTLLALLMLFKLIRLSKPTYIFYLLGFLLMESLLFYKGTVIWLGGSLFKNYYQLLSVASLLLFLAIGMLFLPQFRKNDS